MAIGSWGWKKGKTNQTIPNGKGQIKSSRQPSQADDRNITLKKITYFLQSKGVPFVFPFGITLHIIHLDGGIMLWEKESFVCNYLVEVYSNT